VKISGDKLKMMAEQSGATIESLASALPKGERRKQGGEAQKKVRNWLAGRDHPRCKPAEVTAMAGALGCRPKDLVRFQSQFKYARSSWRKTDLVLDLIRGKRVDEADALLRFSPKRAAVMVRKALHAAIADAEAADASVERLFVTESRVDEGPTIKRFQPKDRGRSHPILKRTSHIIVGVEEAL